MQVKHRKCVFRATYFSLKFVAIVFISLSCDSITSSQIILESSIILTKYSPFSQLHVAGFQT